MVVGEGFLVIAASLAFLISTTSINNLTKKSKNLETQDERLSTPTATKPVSGQKTS